MSGGTKTWIVPVGTDSICFRPMYLDPLLLQHPQQVLLWLSSLLITLRDPQPPIQTSSWQIKKMHALLHKICIRDTMKWLKKRQWHQWLQCPTRQPQAYQPLQPLQAPKEPQVPQSLQAPQHLLWPQILFSISAALHPASSAVAQIWTVAVQMPCQVHRSPNSDFAHLVIFKIKWKCKWCNEYITNWLISALSLH